MYLWPIFIHSNWMVSINIYKLIISIILPVEDQHWHHWYLHKTQLPVPIPALHILLPSVLAQLPSHQKCYSLLGGAGTAFQDNPECKFSTIISHLTTGTQVHSHSSRGSGSRCNHCANPTSSLPCTEQGSQGVLEIRTCLHWLLLERALNTGSSAALLACVVQCCLVFVLWYKLQTKLWSIPHPVFGYS